MSHLGDFDASAIIYGKFSTYRPSTGATFTLGGSPVLSVYKDNSTTQSTTGVTLTADFDSVTGLNHFAIDTSADGTFYAAGSFFDIVITTGTVDSVSVTGSVVGSFSIRKNSAIKPTTAGRTLDVSAGGEAGVDWANVGSPTTSLALTGTTIATTQKVDIETIKTQAVTCAAGVTVPATIASATNITAGTITTVTNLTNAPTAGDFTATMKTSIGTAVAASAVASVTATVSANMIQISGDTTAADNLETFFDDTAGAVPWAGIIDQGTAQSASGTTLVLRAAAAFADDSINGATIEITGSSGAATAVGQSRVITDYVTATDTATVDAWSVTPSGTITYKIFGTAPSSGGGLDAAGVRAAVGLATANLDTQLSGLDTKLNTIDDFVDTEVAAILAAVDTEVAAIKAKTDQLTFTTANQVDASTLSIAVNAITATAIAADAITASKIATGAVDADALATDAVNEIADGVLDRNMGTGSDSGSPTVRTVRQALRACRNRVNIAAGTATIYKEDDSTASWTAAVTTTAGNPISQVDPA